MHSTHTALSYSLRLAEIIPTVVDDFVPLVEVSASWSHKTNASMGNTLKPKKLKHAPSVSLTPLTAPSTSEYRQFVAVLTDPDAKARDDPVWAEFAHWIAYWPTEGKKIDVLGYKPPAPPKRTWKHRYVMVVLTPVNGTTDRLSLAEPKGRKRWGYEGVREGVRRWAGENGLGVVGVNWVMAMDRKQ